MSASSAEVKTECAPYFLFWRNGHKDLKVALRFSGVNFVSLNFIDYVSMALCMGDNRVGDTSDLLDLPQEMGLARRGSF